MSEDKFDVDFEEDVEEAVEESNTEVVEEDGFDVEENKKKASKEGAFNKDESSKKEEKSTEVENVSDSTELVDDGSNPLDDIELDSSMLSSKGVITGKIGTKVSSYPIEKMRFTQAKKELIGIMTSNPLIVKKHYDENTGSFLCFDGKCCDALGLPQVRYLFPVVVYDTDKKGKPVSKDVDIKILQLGRELYDDIITIDEMHGNVSSIDLLVTCKDEQYQRLSFTPAGKARWRTSGEVKKYVYEFWKNNNKYATRAVARNISEKKFLEEMDISDVQDTVDDQDFEDAFDM